MMLGSRSVDCRPWKKPLGTAGHGRSILVLKKIMGQLSDREEEAE
jgi:hypothetical protein